MPFGVLFTVGVLSGCVQHVGGTEGLGQRTAYLLLVVEAPAMRGWRTQFTVADVNAALEDEELDAADLEQALEAVLRCPQAVTAEVQPGSHALRLEGWCHRTLRLPLLPPTEEQRQPESDYRQDAFCLRLPVGASGWMDAQQGAVFADINAGLLDFMQQQSQQQAAGLVRLHVQLQQLAEHAAGVHSLAEKATKLLVKAAPASVREEGVKSPHTVLQLQEASQALKPLLDRSGSGPAAAAAAAAAGLAGPSTVSLLSQLLGGTQSVGVLTFSQAAGGAGPAAGGGGSSSSGAAAAGTGGGGSRFGPAPANGGRTYHVRQAQEDKALRQVLVDHTASVKEWLQLAQQLGQRDVHVPRQPHVMQWQPRPQQGLGAAAAAAAAGGVGEPHDAAAAEDAAAAATQPAPGGAEDVLAAAAAAGGEGGDGAAGGLEAQPMVPAKTRQVRKRGAVQAAATGSKRPALLSRGHR